ncbi:MAG: HWE histidine kinase domain-containing protein [Pseudomonadota bacterium]|nr:HWE histidine kinase domain-containing protein [Pseudomonadota bacterium]
MEPYQLKIAFEHMPQAAMIIDQDHVFVNVNEAYCVAVQRTREDMIGRYVFDVFPDTPERIKITKTIFNTSLNGETTRLLNQPYKLLMPDGSFEDRIWDIEQHPIYASDGKITSMVQFCDDVTEREALRKERDLVSAELSHRVRNTLAVVQSVAEHTGYASTSIAQFLSSFSGRLSSISRNFTALSEANWRGLDLEQIIKIELAPYVGPTRDRGASSGPKLTMSVKATKDASMIIHELITNASKYGFLTKPDASLEIRWQLEDDHLNVQWKETGLSGIREPAHTGFGFQLFDMFPNVGLQKTFADDGLKLTAQIPVLVVGDELIFA